MILGNKGSFSHPITTLMYVQATAKHKEQSGQPGPAPSDPALKPGENHCHKFMVKELHSRLVTREPGQPQHEHREHPSPALAPDFWISE